MEDEEVMLNLFRVKGAHCIDEARIACERGENQLGERKLDQIIQ